MCSYLLSRDKDYCIWYYHTESEAAPSLVPVYKEWPIPPNNISFSALAPLTLRSSYPSSKSLLQDSSSAVLLVVTTGCTPSIGEVIVAVQHFTFH